MAEKARLFNDNNTLEKILRSTTPAGIKDLGRKVKITKERGEVIKWQDKILLLTYHPAYVLRNPKEEETLFKDIKRAIEIAYKGL